MQEMQVQSLGWEDPLEEEMSTHSRILAWEIPWTEEPGELHRVTELDMTEQLGMHACVRNQDLGARCVHCYWVVMASRPFQLTEQGNICVCANIVYYCCCSAAVMSNSVIP